MSVGKVSLEVSEELGRQIREHVLRLNVPVEEVISRSMRLFEMMARWKKMGLKPCMIAPGDIHMPMDVAE